VGSWPLFVGSAYLFQFVLNMTQQQKAGKASDYKKKQLEQHVAPH